MFIPSEFSATALLTSFFSTSSGTIACQVGAMSALLRQGRGWGNMPLPLVQPDLDDDTLMRLAIPDPHGGIYRFAGVWRRDTPPGPAASWLLDQLVALGAGDIDEEGFAGI
ncbi:hypothetical protein I6F26_15375 [Ensifer sp. IC3342]|nr:hypothetical protein [Ensifer sp. BRP08]MCA1447960.1 hypothetical protein [Ensifer sp. IC3342]